MVILERPDAPDDAAHAALELLLTKHGDELANLVGTTRLELAITRGVSSGADLAWLADAATPTIARKLGPYVAASHAGIDPLEARLEDVTRAARLERTGAAWAMAIAHSASPAVARSALADLRALRIEEALRTRDAPRSTEFDQRFEIDRAITTCGSLRGTDVYYQATPPLSHMTPQAWIDSAAGRAQAAQASDWVIAWQASRLDLGAAVNDVAVAVGAVDHHAARVRADSESAFFDVAERAAHLVLTTLHPAATRAHRAQLAQHLLQYPLVPYDDQESELAEYLQAVTRVVQAADVMVALCALPLPQLTTLPAHLVAWHLRMMVTRLWLTHATVVRGAISLEGSFTGSLTDLFGAAKAITT